MNTNLTGSGEGIITALGQYGGSSLIVLALVLSLCGFIVWQLMKRQTIESERSAQAQKELLAVNQEVSKDFKTTVEQISNNHAVERKEMRQEFREMQRENQQFLSDLTKGK